MRIALLLAVALASGCVGPIPFPPPAMNPVDLRRQAPGEVEVFAAGSAVPDTEIGNPFGGRLQGGLLWGLHEKLTLGLRAGWVEGGVSWGAHAVTPVATRGRWSLDLFGGLGGAVASRLEKRCEDGSSMVGLSCPDDWRGRTLRWLSFAPNLGVRSTWRVGERLDLGFLVRTSYSRTFITQPAWGDEKEHSLFLLESMVGLNYAITPGLRAGLALAGYHSLRRLHVPFPALNGSISYAFGGR